MFFYYRTVESGSGAWKHAPIEEFENIKQNEAFHVSTLCFSEISDSDTVRQKGDVWIDVDFKGGTLGANIDNAIDDVRRLQQYLVMSGVDLNSVGLFISGGKGFHMRIQEESFGGIALQKLWAVHKKIVQSLVFRTGCRGVDYNLYKGKKGATIRVENKLRSDGRYKVPITWEEFDSLDNQTYLELAKSPRPVIPLTKAIPVNALITLFSDAVYEVTEETKAAKIPSVGGNFLSETDGKHPPCIQFLAKNENIAKDATSFNDAKMGMARYIVDAKTITTESKENLIREFCENFPSTRHATAQERERELRSAIHSWQGKVEFSCYFASKPLADKNLACLKCPVKIAAVSSAGADCRITQVGNSYHSRAMKKGDSMIANFVFDVRKISYELDEDGKEINIKMRGMILYLREDLKPEPFCLTYDDLKNKNSMVEFVKNYGNALWEGSDMDAQYLKLYLKSQEAVNGVERVMPVTKLGINHIIDTSRGIDELCWVQTNWSINAAGVPNTVYWQGQRMSGETGEDTSLAIDFKQVQAVETELSARVMESLLLSRGVKEVSMILGWVCACWVKPQLQRGTYQETFPILHLFGVPGSGKTELSKTFAILGGFDGLNNQTINISGCSPYSLEALAMKTTTIPILLDEYNLNKAKTEQLVKAVREILKSSASKMAITKGRVMNKRGSGEVEIDTKICSAPIVFMSTSQNAESEIEQRAIMLRLNKRDVKEGTSFNANYKFVSDHKLELYRYAKMLMEEVVRFHPQDLEDMWKETAWVLKAVKADPRKAKSVRCVLVGLQIALRAFRAAKCSENVVKLVEDCYFTGVKAFLEDPNNSHFFNESKSQIDKTIEEIFEVSQYEERGEPILKRGVHYDFDETHVHLKIGAIFFKFIPIAKKLDWHIEFPTAAIFIRELTGCEYFSGTGIARGVTSVSEWYSFSIEGMRDKDIMISKLGL